MQQCCTRACMLVRFSISNMWQQGSQAHATCRAQQCCDVLHSNVAIVWPELANAELSMLGYVVLKCWDRLARVFFSRQLTLGSHAEMKSLTGNLGACSPRKFWNWEALKCNFTLERLLLFPQKSILEKVKMPRVSRPVHTRELAPETLSRVSTPTSTHKGHHNGAEWWNYPIGAWEWKK